MDTVIDTIDAIGAAAPSPNILLDIYNPKIYARGTRTNMDDVIPFIIAKVVRPHPFKNPLRLNFKATNIKSKLKDLRY